VHADEVRFLRAQTGKPVKFTLPGPMTMVDTLHDAHYRSRERLAMAFAAILNAEARELEALGVDVVQFDEPAFNVYFDEVRDWGIAALERAAQGLACATAVHICYGYGIKANVEWKKTLGSEWRQYEQTFPLLARSAIRQVSLECANSHVPIDLLGLLQGIRWGVIFYIRKFSKLNLLYGSLFSIICFILVAYLFAAAYLYGASVIGVLERTGGERSIPEKEEGEPVASTGGD